MNSIHDQKAGLHGYLLASQQQISTNVWLNAPIYPSITLVPSVSKAVFRVSTFDVVS